MVSRRGSRSALARHYLDRGGAGAGSDHRFEIRTFVVFRAVGLIDTIVDRSVHRLEADAPIAGENRAGLSRSLPELRATPDRLRQSSGYAPFRYRATAVRALEFCI